MPRSPLAQSEGVPVAAGGHADGRQPESGPAAGGLTRWAERPGVRVAGLSLALAVPLLVGLAVLTSPPWHPLSDVAMMELTIRDVGTRHSPLVGVYGRFEGFGENGSHPGPLLFYLLWPVYRLAGADGTALQLSSLVLAFGAGVASIWIGHRRGGWPFALAVTGVVVLLARAYGASMLAEAWNPNVAMLWWPVFLLAVWSVLCRDLPLLPVAVFAGSLCVQAHVGYAGLVGGLLGATAVWLAVAVVRAPARAVRRRALRWSGLAVAAGVLLWLPPVIDEVINDPGNVEILVEGLRNPTDERSPLGDVVEVWLAHLDPVELVTGDLTPYGSIVPGLVALGVWLAAAGVAWRRRRRDPALVRLHLVVGGAALLGLASIGRIVGPIWAYLTLWAWGTTALMVLAVVWTLVARAPAAEEAPAAPLAVPGPAHPAPALAALAVITLLLSSLFTVDSASAEMHDAALSRMVDELADATVARLRQDPSGCGDECRYQVTWADPIYIGSPGFGMLAELERRGFDVGAPPREAARLDGHWIVPTDEADAVVHVAVTDELIEGARAAPGAEEVAYADPYTAAEHERHAELRRRTADALRSEGFGDAADQAAASGYQQMIPSDAAMSDQLLELIRRANAVYRPVAVFLLPPEAG